MRNELHFIIMNLEPPYSKVTLAVDDDRGLAFSKEQVGATLRFLRWATPDRLVFAPTAEVIRLGGESGQNTCRPFKRSMRTGQTRAR